MGKIRKCRHKKVANAAAARYFNLETTIFRESEGLWGFSLNGGSYLRADPKVLGDLKGYGFNMTSFVNNHSLDYDIPGLLRTMKKVTESGLVHASASAFCCDT